MGINAPPSTTSGIHLVTGGDQVEIHFWAPNATYVSTLPLLVAQPFPTGNLPWGPILFPEVHLSALPSAPYPIVVIYDGTLLSLVPGLGTYGFNTIATIPLGMAPISIMLQGYCLAPNPNNPIFTSTAAHEIRVQ